MSNEFCVRCIEKESEIELLRKKIWELQQEIDKLSFDLAFYNGSITNLPCNEK